MPPKKATAAAPAPAPSSPSTAQLTGGGDTSILSTTSATVEPKSPTTTTSKSRKSQSDDIGIDDLLLPRSLTSRIARGVLPPNTSLQKDAILAITKSATVFISALASNANDLTARKTIQAGDVMKALKEMELDTVMRLGQVGDDGRVGGRLERELEVYEEGVKGKRKGYREKVKARESGISVDASGIMEETQRGEDGEPEAKRARRASHSGDDEEDDEDLLNKQLNGEATNGHAEEGEDIKDVDGERDDNDETEDDPDVHEDEGEEEDEPEDEDEDLEQGHENGDEDRVDVEESPQKANRYVLAPDGRAEVGSGDESD